MIGHRGAAAHAPENTMKSFDLAWKMGTDMVETDVWETSDGHIVCMHDRELSRTTNGEGYIDETPLDVLSKLDAGGGERVPLLGDVLEFAHGRFGVNIELKIPDIEEKVLDLVMETKMIEDVIISSFHHSSMGVIRAMNDVIPTAVLVNSEIEQLATYASNLRTTAINPLFWLVTEELVESSHDLGLKVYPWTVNDEELIAEQLKMRVDGIITDFPQLAVDTIDDFIMKKHVEDKW
ncbi:MAG: glycerophosphodiester phosphodiesterase [Candidatus Thorarchaeota archaeon]